MLWWFDGFVLLVVCGLVGLCLTCGFGQLLFMLRLRFGCLAVSWCLLFYLRCFEFCRYDLEFKVLW